MNILVTLDSNYVGPLTVFLKSLMITNPNNEFDIYVAHSSLTEEDFIKIKNAKMKSIFLKKISTPWLLNLHLLKNLKIILLPTFPTR